MRIGTTAMETGGAQALVKLADQLRRAADDGLTSVWMANIVPRLSRTPGLIRHTGTTEVGGNREEVLQGLGEAPAQAETTQQEEPDARS